MQKSTNARFDLARIVGAFRRAGGDEVAEIVACVYGGGRSQRRSGARCWTLFGPWVPGEQEKARVIVNRELNAPGLKLMGRFDILDQLANVDCPTLVCVGSLDPITPVAAAREIVDALPAGSAQLEVIEGAGHFPWKDVPDRYWLLVTGFVATVTMTQAGLKRSASG